jgi:hypothetical protein
MITLENRILFTFLRWFPSLPYPQPWVRVQHPTRPVGLVGWHVRPPLCFGKKIAQTEWISSEATWEFFSAFQFFQLDPRAESVVFFVSWCF